MDENFLQEMTAGYTFDEPSLVLGAPMLEGEIVPDAPVRLPLSMVNRHGLVAGATGTGKTKTLQILAGQLSDTGVPVFVSDVKGDLTGISQPGDATAGPIVERAAQLGITYQARAHPVELLSLSGQLGAQVRATVSSFGPILLGKVLDLNKTQVSVLTLVFAYCDDQRLPLLDLADLRTTLRFLSSDEGKPTLEEYGGFSKATIGVLLRSIVELEAAGADAFFGEPEFDARDLMRATPDGHGIVTLLELADVMDRPRLFSTFMLWMLAQLYAKLPEEGDLPKPKLVFFFDEAHLLFDDASEALMEQIELTARLIRSKGVGVYFVTQAPGDVPSSVLSQLGNRVQHALRAHTPDDEANLRRTVKTFPRTEHYDVGETLTSLGIGEALVTVLSPEGVPTPLAATRLVPPDSLMDAVDDVTREQLIAAGSLRAKYAEPLDRESAHEIITARLNGAAEVAGAQTGEPTGGAPLPPPPPGGPPASTPSVGSPPPTKPKTSPKTKPSQKPKASGRAKVGTKSEADGDGGLADDVKDIGVGFAKDMLTTADGRRTLRTVFGALFGKK
ncbi:MAG: helicase HerA-like domain-containing protein [Actinomycetota bacterium]